MEKNRFMLIHKDTCVYLFDSLEQAKDYAAIHCRGHYEFYVIVDKVKNEVAYKWSY